uniref:Uncharacterized protein n=1 Tax=Rousettus aegyptiacus TaxID=9407 RepID=A0A7J8BE43_ROUAE|nr:hypothetical protein HJG63_009760 [Rousettus aegyptiacus]
MPRNQPRWNSAADNTTARCSPFTGGCAAHAALWRPGRGAVPTWARLCPGSQMGTCETCYDLRSQSLPPTFHGPKHVHGQAGRRGIEARGTRGPWARPAVTAGHEPVIQPPTARATESGGPGAGPTRAHRASAQGQKWIPTRGHSCSLRRVLGKWPF